MDTGLVEVKVIGPDGRTVPAWVMSRRLNDEERRSVEQHIAEQYDLPGFSLPG